MANALVSIKALQNMRWCKHTDCGFEVSHACDIWRISITAKLPEMNQLTLLLTKDELERANRYYREYDRQRFIISRGYLRILLGRYLYKAPQGLIFEIGENKKPFLSGSELQYNISHSGDCILIGISDLAIGVDVEKPDPKMHFDEIMELSLSQPEISFVKCSFSKIEAFYELWTRKEAVLKATAKGIDDDLRYIPGLAGEHYILPAIIGSEKTWFVHSFNVNHDHIGSVACLNEKCNFWEFG
jgi:4'-phosphopantetheinyl transferase